MEILRVKKSRPVLFLICPATQNKLDGANVQLNVRLSLTTKIIKDAISKILNGI